jgi:dUTP pyrophosphatase
MTPIKVKKLRENAKLPVKTTEGAAGYDLTAATEEKLKMIRDVPYLEYKTGLAIQIPEGHAGLLMARSSISKDKTLMMGASVGLLDADFTGEITFVFKELGRGSGVKYNVGDRIGQLVIIPIVDDAVFMEVDELPPTTRGSSGYGSSGK